MLFKQLYNWIKYKTLPPSLLFKNRLFIERDSKNKRIFSNLGLTFRNSKWTDFQTSNTSARFTLTYGKYLRYAVIAIFVIIVIWKLNFLYNYTFLLNTVLFFYWMTIDAIDYYVAFLFWILISTAFILKNVVYSYFFFNNLSVVKKNPSSMRNKNLKNHVGLNHVKFLTKKDIKMIALEWVNTSKNPLKNKAISIFFTHQNKHPLIANPALFYNLFRSHYFLNFEKRYATVDALSLWFKTLTKTNTPFCASRLMLGESTIPYSSNLLDYFLRTERGASMFNGNTASTAFYQTRYVWNIANAASLSTRTPVPRHPNFLPTLFDSCVFCE